MKLLLALATLLLAGCAHNGQPIRVYGSGGTTEGACPTCFGAYDLGLESHRRALGLNR